MTEEEKKTFNFLKTFVKTEIDYCKLEKADALDILNIIEKLQKEIEEKTTIIMAGAEKVKQLEKEFITKQEIKENYIPKDKIREIIEELEKDYIPKSKIRKLEDMWNDNIWNATDEASEEKAEMIRDVYRGLLDE